MNYIDMAKKEYENRNENQVFNSDFCFAREIIQKLTLFSLSKTDFFERSAFCGGTMLRIFHKIDRYSEDLDFSLCKSDKTFRWDNYVDFLYSDLRKNGIDLDFKLKDNDMAVQKCFIKDYSLAKRFDLDFVRHAYTAQKVLIKMEVDTNPPEGAETEKTKEGIRVFNLNSAMAGKCHALTQRGYVKGRDWFDFIWYVKNKIEPNYTLLKNALLQSGGADEKTVINSSWLINKLTEKLSAIDKSEILKDLDLFISNDKYIHLERTGINSFKDAIKEFSNYAQDIDNQLKPKKTLKL